LYLVYAAVTVPWALGVTLQQVRLRMAEMEKARAEAGASIIHDVSTGAFLILGMDIQVVQ
jgi:hypothetical protein